MAKEQVISMTNKNYQIGRRFEYRVQNYFRKYGYYVIRSYASKGLLDLIAIPPNTASSSSEKTVWRNKQTKPVGVQCKKTKDGKGYVSREERKSLIENEKKWRMTILIAWSDKKRRLKFRTVKGKAFSKQVLEWWKPKPEPPIDWKKAQQELIKVGENLQ